MSFPPKNNSISQPSHNSSEPLLKENGGPGRARILLVTLRGLTTHAAWCSNFEFEDVIRSVDDVDVLELESAPLFDTARFTRHLEAAYKTMQQRQADGVAPVSFAVPA